MRCFKLHLKYIFIDPHVKAITLLLFYFWLFWGMINPNLPLDAAQGMY